MTVFHSWVVAVSLSSQSINNHEDKNFCLSSVLSYQHFFNIDIQKIMYLQHAIMKERFF